MYNKKLKSLSMYRIFPRVVKAGVEQTISICPMGKSRYFDDNKEYIVSFLPMEMHGNIDHLPDTSPIFTWDPVRVKPENGMIRVNYVFEEEQQWTISVITPEDAEQKRTPLYFMVYSLYDDLYERTPYIGDLHVHSRASDGNEEAEITAANYRKNGYDFIALTDHHKWKPSDDLIKAFADVPLGMGLFHGEEVHVDGVMHIVNFGGKYGITDLYQEKSEEVDAKIKAELETLEVPKGVNAVSFAYRKWVVEEIRKAGGIAILSHPFWMRRQAYDTSPVLLDYMLEKGVYDAVEFISGQSVYENDLQIAFFNDQREKGRRLPCVGISDSHGTDPVSWFGIGRTMVFAKNLDERSIQEAIMGMYSLAIEKYDQEQPRLYGSYRMVKYARFLLDHYFPAHDEFCVEEGLLMREYALGNEQAGEALRALATRMQRFAQKTLKGEKV